jgi:hypothetical protein
MSGEDAAKILHGLEPIVEFRQLSAQQIAHLATLCCAACCDQILYLFKRKAQILCPLDETYSLNVFGLEESKTTGRPCGSGQELDPLVVTKSVDAYARTLRYLADL